MAVRRPRARSLDRGVRCVRGGWYCRRLVPAADLYLDLLKRSLTRYGFEDGLLPYDPQTAWVRRAWPLARRVFDRAGVVPMAHAPASLLELRQDGRDWPQRAETMIGLRRLDNLQSCIENVIADDVPGDLLEAGVWRGGASIFMRGALDAFGDTSRTVWLADSFQGLPKPRPEHAADADDRHWMQPFLAVSVDDVRANFERYGLLDDRVRFLEGWFADTLAVAPIEELSLLRADGDMYGSTTDILTALYPKVAVGGFVVIDDYGAIAGCKLATDHYRAANEISEPLVEIDWTGVFWRRER